MNTLLLKGATPGEQGVIFSRNPVRASKRDTEVSLLSIKSDAPPGTTNRLPRRGFQ